MKYVEINERAAAMAMDFVVGEEARGDIEALYALLDQVERLGFDEGYACVDSEAGYKAGYADGYETGYHDGLVTPDYYEGDSGDETAYRGRQPGETQFVRGG